MAGFDRLTPEGKRFYAMLDEIKELEVRVGYQAGDAADDRGVDMCAIAAWNELGTSDMPARPFLRNTADNHSDELKSFAQAQAGQLVSGGSAESCLNNLGVFAKGLVQEEIGSGSFAANAPSTIRKKGSSTPLIDTGRLRQSVNFVIKPKGGG